ncbi:MAG: tetratricopeptide repeat protein [Verrucomicrobia bacterium]|nr:tetratricopeptide repeat protein [Verrucomicrobiota bacterium]
MGTRNSIWRQLAWTIGALTVFLGLAFWIAITPDSFLAGMFRTRITRTDAHVVIGPYPTEDDFLILKRHRIGAIVSLLDPRLPYERVLLEREKAIAVRYGMRFFNYPMVSLWGHGVGEQYEKNAVAAAEVAAGETNKVYVHCYLGLHRTKSVQELLAAQGTTSDVYLIRRAERHDRAQKLDQANADFHAGKFAAVVANLESLGPLDPPVQMLLAWAKYRLGDIAGARVRFAGALAASPDFSEAHDGLGYCALRENMLEDAAQQFSAVLRVEPASPSAQVGLGMVRYRQNNSREAARLLESALQADPRNQEARDLLEKIKTDASKKRNY